MHAYITEHNQQQITNWLKITTVPTAHLFCSNHKTQHCSNS